MNNPVDDITQSQKRKILAEDRDRLATYHALAQSSMDDERGGRYAAVSRPATFVGASPIHHYPRLPADSPSNQMAKMPEEPNLGYDVNAMDAVGEVFEQEASKSTGDAAAPVPARRGWRRF